MGNLFGIEKGILCQQVNCCGAMGAGLAKAILERYPIVKTEFNKYYKSSTNSSNLCHKCHFNQLGTYQVIPVDENLYVANIYSQDFYGNPSKTGKIYTKIDKLIACIEDIAKKNSDKNVYIPCSIGYESHDKIYHGIGCGYGGEKWENVLQRLIDLRLPNLYLVDTQEQKICCIVPYIRERHYDLGKCRHASVMPVTGNDTERLFGTYSDLANWANQNESHEMEGFMTKEEALKDSPIPLPFYDCYCVDIGEATTDSVIIDMEI